jgi:hypothetical protein
MRRPLPRLVQETAEISNASLQAAFAALPAQQPLNQLTNSVHAAAWCTLSGEIICVREDVGRHKIVRADFNGTEINILAPEGAEISSEMNRVVFDPAGINIYSNSWRVAPKVA